ncbi:hypothetical protein GCM10007981_02620 [Thermocladium modestius]|uniref:Uncharacterized protein n=1 Tax=Thermocladium modestius TaxID=62609 RepID=A0A830GR92_9CREN|nr:hypothetical protein [Thermocladium modestius]GGP19338.1 hypothetical protein GCM10007981_02620 [Thermocladium modestius]
MNVKYIRPLEVKIDPDPSACLVIIRRGSESTKGRRTTWGTYLLDDYLELGDDVVVMPSGSSR